MGLDSWSVMAGTKGVRSERESARAMGTLPGKGGPHLRKLLSSVGFVAPPLSIWVGWRECWLV